MQATQYVTIAAVRDPPDLQVREVRLGRPDPEIPSPPPPPASSLDPLLSYLKNIRQTKHPFISSICR